MQLIDWLEKAAIANLQSKHENVELINREANTTLNFIFSAIGVTTAYFLYQWNNEKDIAIIALLLSLYLVVCALILIKKCLMLEDFPALYNEYKNLNQPSLEFLELRQLELENIQKRCEEADIIILNRSNWLNRLRVGVAISPILATLVFLIQQTLC